MMEQLSLALRNQSYGRVRLGERQNDVYEAILKYQPVSNRQLSNILHWPINSVTGRVKELREMGMVINSGTAFDEMTERTVCLWAANNF